VDRRGERKKTRKRSLISIYSECSYISEEGEKYVGDDEGCEGYEMKEEEYERWRKWLIDIIGRDSAKNGG